MNKKLYDLTFPQKSILLTEKYYQNTSINNICGTAIIEDKLDYKMLQKAINLVIKNNDSFLIHLIQTNTDIKQYICDFEEKNIEIINIKNKDEISDIENNILKKHFSLFDTDLFEFKIFRFENGSGGFLLNIHHLISDAWTLGLTCRKIIHTYSELLGLPQKNDKNINVSYCSYIENEQLYLKSEKFNKDKEYWDKIFSTVPNIVNIPNSKKNLSKTISCEGNRLSFKISKKQTNLISEFCANEKISILNFFMTVLSIYIYKMTNVNDFVIGTPILNRSNFAEKNTTGMFINIAPLRVQLDNSSSFSDIVSKISVNLIGLLRHQRYPYSEILKNIRKKDLNFPALFNILLSYQITKANSESNLSYSTRWAFNGTCADDIDIQLYDLDETGELNISYDYKIEKYSKTTITDLHNKLFLIIQQIIDNKHITLDKITILSESEKEHILIDFNKTQLEYLKEKTIVELFENQVQKNPKTIAVKFENEIITYEDINSKANQIANFLRTEKNIKPGDFVGVLLNRSIDLIATILGVVKSGATYVAIDPEYPKDRISYMLENCKAKVLFVNSQTNDIIDNSSIIKTNISLEKISDFSSENPKIISSFDDLLYVIYTSGSTGKPKGVSIKNYNVHNFIEGMRKIIDFSKLNSMVSVATVCFDMFVFELWGTLLNGLTLVLANEEQQKLPSLLNKLCIDNNVDIFQTTPSRFKLLFDNNTTECFSIVKHILIGGEAVPEKIFKQFLSFDNLEIHHMYGPTETTVWSTQKTITNVDNITIGKPIANTQVYILDEYHNICPIGVAGELYISGDGVGNGYLHKEDLNKLSFIPNPFIPGNVLYKTGDSGYFNENGEIIYLNRIDNQIKIRGFRVELGEIEKIIFEFPNIKNCVVIKKVLPNSHEILCAYYIETSTVNVSSLKKLLQQTLPNYMVPQYFIKLNEFPYTPNGKIDRKSLPLPNLEEKKHAFVKSRNKTDKILIEILKELLSLNNIDISDNLFEFGMDSLIAINLSIKILDIFNIQLNITDIFNHPIIKDLSDFIVNSKNSQVISHIPTIEKKDYYPLSSAQKRIYYASLLDGNNSVLYNVSGGIIFDKLPDIQKLNDSIKKLLSRHESFRTYFEIENNEIVQKITENVDFSLKYEKVSTNDINFLFKEFIKPFSLSKAPLFRAKLIELDNNKSILLVDTHHIICDGASLNILIKDLCSLYNEENLQVLNTTYKDFAVWETSHTNSKTFRESEEFWLNQFKETVPVLNLSTTFPRPATKSYNGNLLIEDLDISLSTKIKNICKKYNTTPNIILLSAYFILLHKYTGQNDIVIGSPIVGRELPELNNIIGMFVNTLPLRNKINPSSTVLNFINKIKENCSQAFSHQDYPFDTLVNKIDAPRDASRNFLFDLLFTYQTNGYSDINFNNLKAEHFRPDDCTSKFDISLEVLPINNTFRLTFEYCTELFNKEYIEQFSKHYKYTVNTMLDNLESKISELSVLTDEERNYILYTLNNTSMQYNVGKTLSKLFEEQVQKTPNDIAIVFEDKSMTYSELNKKSNQLAWHLRNLGLGENSIVGIILPRSLEVIIAMLGALKAGICYIPIDPTLPEARITYMLSNSNCKTILTFKNIKQNSFINKLDLLNIIDINLNSSEIYNGKYKNLNLTINPDSPSYIIYTSGSTGKPKGVMLKQKALSNLANYLNKNVAFLENEYSNIAMASITTISFDIFIFETLICLQRGLKIVIANENEQNTPALLDDLIFKNDIKCIQMTPSRMALFLKNINLMPHLNQLEYIVLAGEALSKELRDNILKLGNITIYNGYGPSETTVFSTFTNATYQKEINIGNPLGNTQIYVLDQHLNPMPINEVGEIYISGDGVAIEYVNNEKITKERFVKNPFIENSIMYRTGDLAKILPNGELFYIGRADNQVKIRGLRIELDEIEKCILKYKHIEKCVISEKKDINERQFLVAYLLVNDHISTHKLREFLKSLLPKYMIPTYFIILDTFPYLPNGKIDKKALFALNPKEQNNENHYVAPKTKLEVKLANIFQNLLSITPIGINDNFFELGGDSLLAINLQIELSKITNSITYADIFLNPTISDLVNKIKQTKKENASNLDSNDFTKYDIVLKKNNLLPNTIKKVSIGNILISGTTGFLGAHILDEFLKNESGIAYCIIRPESGITTRTKLINKLHYYFGKKYDKLIDERIKIIEMDISIDNFNLSSEELKTLSKNVDCVINSAAKVAHFGQYELFKKVNVDGVENLLKFCKKYNKKFYQISTVSISGTNLTDTVLENKKLFLEDNFYIGQPLNNVYVKSKFEAEKIILDYILKGTDAYIIRVGNLMNRFSDMKFQPNIEENAFINRLTSFIKLGVLPEYLSNEYLEFTPVDLCAESILKLIQHPTQKNRIFHVFNQNHVPIKDFISQVKYFKEFNIISEDNFLRTIDSIINSKNSDKILSGIIKDFDTNKKIQYRSNIIVKNDFSNKYLKKLDFIWPKIDTLYLQNFIKYILNLK